MKKTLKKLLKKTKLYLKNIKKDIDRYIKKLVKKKKSKNKKVVKNRKLDYKTFTISQIENELRKTKYNEKYFKILRSTIYSLIVIVSIALIVATLIMPVFQISTNSMNDYKQGDIVVAIKTKKINAGDIIAFYHGNKILVKRVIATSGNWVVIDKDGNIFVDGVKLDEPYIKEKKAIEYDIKIPYQVPNESWFVLNDNREDMVDSRNSNIGSIKKEDIIGKILFKIWDNN